MLNVHYSSHVIVLNCLLDACCCGIKKGKTKLQTLQAVRVMIIDQVGFLLICADKLWQLTRRLRPCNCELLSQLSCCMTALMVPDAGCLQLGPIRNVQAPVCVSKAHGVLEARSS